MRDSQKTGFNINLSYGYQLAENLGLGKWVLQQQYPE